MKNRNKKYAIQLLIEKLSDPLLTYADIAEKTNYSIPQLKRLYKQVKEAENVSSLLVHKNKGRTPINKASDFEIKFLRSLKENYPIITISHFRDIFIEDILENPDYSSFVNQHHLKPRSLSWFRSLFMKEGWKSPAKRKPLRRDGRSVHPLRKPAAQKGLLIQLDGTPFDWLGNGEMWTLHLAVDDATSEPLAGWFFPSERQLGYCHVMRLITEKHGIPMSLYTDKHSIFRNNND